jgi:hypothetical protein
MCEFVIEEPLVATTIIGHLLDQNDVRSVRNMQCVFGNRFHDVLSDSRIQARIKSVESTNTFIKTSLHLIQMATNSQSFKRRIRFHDHFFEYIVSNIDIFERMPIVFRHIVKDKLYEYIINEPYYYQQAVYYMTMLFPEETCADETYSEEY